MTDPSTDLYRFYDAAGELLYIGISLHAAVRASQHRATQPWWLHVARMDVERVPGSRKEVEAVERQAIIAERPKHNVVHNADRGGCDAERIEWTCVQCGRVILDGAGYVELPQADWMRWRDEMAAFAARHRQGGPIDGATFILDMPEPIGWQAIHRSCDRFDLTRYHFTVERCRTAEQLAEWDKHLTAKRWIDETNWSDFADAALATITKDAR